jgi:membrane carboxypeptidase/penicillin-binding protein
MLENGFITVAERDAALKQVMKYRAPAEVAVHAEYVAEQARQMIFNQYGAEAYTRGLNVYLTLNSAEQTLAYHALRKGIMDYEKRQVYRGPEDYIDLPAIAASSTRASPKRSRTSPTTTSCARRSSPRRRPRRSSPCCRTATR